MTRAIAITNLSNWDGEDYVISSESVPIFRLSLYTGRRPEKSSYSETQRVLQCGNPF